MTTALKTIKQEVKNGICDGPKVHQYSGILYLIPTKAKAYCEDHYKLAINRLFKEKK